MARQLPKYRSPNRRKASSLTEGATVPGSVSAFRLTRLAPKRHARIAGVSSDCAIARHRNQHELRLRRSRNTHSGTVSYTHLRAHETRHDLVCRLLLGK